MLVIESAHRATNDLVIFVEMALSSHYIKVAKIQFWGFVSTNTSPSLIDLLGAASSRLRLTVHAWNANATPAAQAGGGTVARMGQRERRQRQGWWDSLFGIDDAPGDGSGVFEECPQCNGQGALLVKNSDWA